MASISEQIKVPPRAKKFLRHRDESGRKTLSPAVERGMDQRT
jgi:hypothetical protein